MEKLQPIHPGEILLEDFLKPMSISPKKLAQELKISAETIVNIINKKHPITAEMALRLGHYFQISPQFWLGLQMDYDLDLAEDTLREQINQEVVVFR